MPSTYILKVPPQQQGKVQFGTFVSESVLYPVRISNLYGLYMAYMALYIHYKAKCLWTPHQSHLYVLCEHSVPHSAPPLLL